MLDQRQNNSFAYRQIRGWPCFTSMECPTLNWFKFLFSSFLKWVQEWTQTCTRRQQTKIKSSFVAFSPALNDWSMHSTAWIDYQSKIWETCWLQYKIWGFACQQMEYLNQKHLRHIVRVHKLIRSSLSLWINVFKSFFARQTCHHFSVSRLWYVKVPLTSSTPSYRVPHFRKQNKTWRLELWSAAGVEW